jgi:hypothetical protein
MLEISTQLFPYRLKMETRQPIELKVTIKNNSREPALVSYDIATEKTLALDKGGYKSTENVKVGVIAPGASVSGRFEVFAKHLAKIGLHKIYIRATEHYNNYNLVKNEYRKEIEVLVDK